MANTSGKSNQCQHKFLSLNLKFDFCPGYEPVKLKNKIKHRREKRPLSNNQTRAQAKRKKNKKQLDFRIPRHVFV